MHLGNVVLSAFLVYRVSRSLLALVTTGLVLLFPVPAHEAIFWNSAGSALLGTLVALVALHLLLTAVSTDRKWGLYAALGLAVFSLVPLIYEQPVTSILILPLFVLAEKPLSWKRLRRVFLLLLLGAVALFLYWYLYLRHSLNMSARGGVDLSLTYLWSERVPTTVQGLGWRLFSLYDFPGFESAWLLGIQRALGSPLAVLVLALLAVSTAFLILLAALQDHQGPLKVRRIMILLAGGCVWAISAMVPILIVSNQIIESRLLYYPLVGLCFILAAGVAFVGAKLHRRWLYALAAVLGFVFVAQIAMMAGFGQVYKLRYEYDKRQLAALADAVPDLPKGEVILLPLHMDEHILSLTGLQDETLERILFGVFEARFSARAATSLLYRKPHSELKALTSSRWGKLSFEGVEGQGAGANLLIDGQSIPANRVLAMSYQDGQAMLYDHVIVRLPDERLAGIELPLARQVGAPQVAYRGLTLDFSQNRPPGEEMSAAEEFGDLVSLVGYSLQDPQPLGVDVPVRRLVTRWSCQNPIPADYTLYVHYLNAAGDRVAQDDHLLGRHMGNDDRERVLPTSQWICPGYYEDVSFVPVDLLEEGGLGAALGLWIPQTNEYLQPTGELPVDQFGRALIDAEELEQAK
jgi:hypothetical protein